MAKEIRHSRFLRSKKKGNLKTIPRKDSLSFFRSAQKTGMTASPLN